ncbi:hypothetical protein Y032_0601g503 [Ancylostoma ceylanicum]|uniref:Ras family protein n=1 Tax=Ancylostoma ceylanicum TaxID=53326 RepID=A0A016WNU1_9BILA|nr:hypothetical protein Y032_0601g503 [Ancylostoma ceylanicum]
MTNLTDVNLVRCVVIGDDQCGKEMMMKKYAAFSGVPYNAERREIVTAFNGRKCVFVDSSSDEADRKGEGPHVFLLCVSVARKASVEETVMMGRISARATRLRCVIFVATERPPPSRSTISPQPNATVLAHIFEYYDLI